MNRSELTSPAALTGQDVVPLMIQTAREHAQGSKQKTKARPSSAGPRVSNPGIEQLMSLKDPLPHSVAQATVAVSSQCFKFVHLACVFMLGYQAGLCMRCLSMKPPQPMLHVMQTTEHAL